MRSLSRPSLHVVDGLLQTHAYRRSVGISEPSLDLQTASSCHADIKDALAVGIVLTHNDVLDMGLGTGIEIHLASNTRQSPEVLIFEIGAVAPAHHLHGYQVLALLQILGDVELGSHLGVLAIAHITAIDPQLEVARGRTDVEQHLLATPPLRQLELAAIAARIVLRLADVGRIVVEGGVPGIVDVLVDGIAVTIELEESWNGEILPRGVIVVGTEETGRSILMVLHKTEAPHALHGEIALRA